MQTLSAATGNAFPQLLTSLSMAKEKYYQPTGVLTHICNANTKRGDWRCLSAAFDKPVYGEGKVLPVTARLITAMYAAPKHRLYTTSAAQQYKFPRKPLQHPYKRGYNYP